jgi:hypothetical protein
MTASDFIGLLAASVLDKDETAQNALLDALREAGQDALADRMGRLLTVAGKVRHYRNAAQDEWDNLPTYPESFHDHDSGISLESEMNALDRVLSDLGEQP